MRTLKDMFKKVAYGDDTRSLTKNIREWLECRGVKATVKKNSLGVRHEGPRVTGEHRGGIELYIEVDKPFNLMQFIHEFEECEFNCDVPDRCMPMPYTIPVEVNKESLYGFNGKLVIGSKFREGVVTEDMFWKKIFEGKQYGDTYTQGLGK